jgi:hypothetical protein
MADIRVDLFPYILDVPPQVIPDTISFALSGITCIGGFGRLGRGYIKTIILLAPVVAPVSPATANYGFVV